jgi:hypothetical protein
MDTSPARFPQGHSHSQIQVPMANAHVTISHSKSTLLTEGGKGYMREP